MTKIILIRGPICAGKSTIAQELLKNLKNCSLIDQDSFKRNIDFAKSSKWRADLAFETALFLADKLMNKRRTIIADIHSSIKKQHEGYIALAKKYKYALFSYLLYPPLGVCLNRNKNRVIPDIKYKISRQKIKKYWEKVHFVPREKTFDTSKMKTKRIVREILAEVNF